MKRITDLADLDPRIPLRVAALLSIFLLVALMSATAVAMLTGYVFFLLVLIPAAGLTTIGLMGLCSLDY